MGKSKKRSGKDGDYITIKTLDDIEHQRNAMAIKNGRYPLNISDCEVVGMNGDCGMNCPIFLNGDCAEFDGDKHDCKDNAMIPIS